MAATSLHDDVLPDSEERHERGFYCASAYHDSLVAGLRAPVVTRWQQRHRVGWDARDGWNPGAERTVWETLLEMERFDYRSGEKQPGTITLVLDLAEAFERVSFPVVWAWATHFNFGRFCVCYAGTLDHQRRVQFEDASRSRSRPSRPPSLDPNGVAFILCAVLQNALSVTAFTEGRNKDLVGIAGKVLKSMKRKVEEEGSEAVNHGRRKRRKEQGGCAMQVSGGEVSGKQQKRRSGCNNVETKGVDLRTRTEQLVAKERAEVRCEILICQAKSRLSENYMKSGVRKC